MPIQRLHVLATADHERVRAIDVVGAIDVFADLLRRMFAGVKMLAAEVGQSPVGRQLIDELRAIARRSRRRIPRRLQTQRTSRCVRSGTFPGSAGAIGSIPTLRCRLATAAALRRGGRRSRRNARVRGTATDRAVVRSHSRSRSVRRSRLIRKQRSTIDSALQHRRSGSGGPSGNFCSNLRMAVLTSPRAIRAVNLPWGRPLNWASSSNQSTIVSMFRRQPSAPQSFIVSTRVSQLHVSLGLANQANMLFSSLPGPGRKRSILIVSGSIAFGQIVAKQRFQFACVLFATLLVDQRHADRDDVDRSRVVVGLAGVAGGRRRANVAAGHLPGDFAGVVVGQMGAVNHAVIPATCPS